MRILTVNNNNRSGHRTPPKQRPEGKKAQKCMITVETNDARMKINAAPTSAEGVLLKKDGAPYEITGYDLISNAQFIDTATSAIINIQYILI